MTKPFFTNSPRVVGSQRADFYSLESLLESPQFVGKRGEELALAIYSYFTSLVDGTYHFWPQDEGYGQPRVRTMVHDPVKLINAYGWLICGQMSSLLQAIYLAAGMRSRKLGEVPGHSLCEVHYEGRWHLLDVDMWTWCRTPEGHLASGYELSRNAEALLVKNEQRAEPCGMPDRPLPGYVKMYSETPTTNGDLRTFLPHSSTQAHTMDFRLRPGECLIRSQLPQGRFHFPESWRDFLSRWSNEWHGEPRERWSPFRTYGNGRWIYEPNLSSEFADFEQACWERIGLSQDNGGLSGPGEFIVRLQSPYPFTGVSDIKSTPISYSDGAWLEMSGSGPVHAYVCNPEGVWINVQGPQADKGKFDHRIDITAQTESRYECLLKLTLGEGARLNQLKFDSYLMTAPGSLPRLVEGKNSMQVRCLDKHHEPTVPWSHVIDFRTGKDPVQQADSTSNAAVVPFIKGWTALGPAGAGPVSATWRFEAPAGRKFVWAYALATVRERPTNQPQGVATLEWSIDGNFWRPLAGIIIPNTTVQWDATVSGEVIPDDTWRAPNLGQTLLVRITSDTPICAMELHGHLLESGHADDQLQITQRWRDGESEKSFIVPAGQTAYALSCGKDPAGHTIEMRVASRAKRR